MSYKMTISSSLRTVLVMAGITFSLAYLHAQTAVIHSFASQSDGRYPFASLILDHDGNLYGTTYDGGNTRFCDGFGCGAVFRLTPTGGGWQETLLRAFTGVNDGLYVYGGIVQDAAGNLYGTTLEAAGSACCGTVYKLAPTSSGPWKETVIYQFTSNSGGGTPMQGSLTLDAAGNLYGTASLGGSSACGGSGCGVAFELSPNSSGMWTETILHTFTGGTDGAQPQTQLVFDKAGNLYGTTSSGGANGVGVVFELSPTSGSWQETVLHTFSTKGDGTSPGAGEALIFDAAGNLYGTTTAGGANGYGIVFELSPASGGAWTETLLYSFAAGKDGKNPGAGVVFDAAGNLYGTTVFGGILQPPLAPKSAPGCGVVYKLAPASGGTWTESVIHHFTCNDGGEPTSAVVIDASGNIYGTTPQGGKYNYGVVYEITP